MDIWKGCSSVSVPWYACIYSSHILLLMQLLKINTVMTKLMEDLLLSLQITVLWIVSAKVMRVPVQIQVLLKMRMEVEMLLRMCCRLVRID